MHSFISPTSVSPSSAVGPRSSSPELFGSSTRNPWHPLMRGCSNRGFSANKSLQLVSVRLFQSVLATNCLCNFSNSTHHSNASGSLFLSRSIPFLTIVADGAFRNGLSNSCPVTTLSNRRRLLNFPCTIHWNILDLPLK